MSEENRQNKNAVFQDGAGMPVQTREDLAKQEFDLDIPVMEAPLPSKGLIYPKGHALHGKETVSFSAMTAREEDLLSSRSLIKSGKVVDELIKSCLVDKSIPVDSLISGDKNAIMFAIRISGYGEDYEASQVCPNCNTKNKLHINLEDLAILPLKINPIALGENLFSFTLPLSKKEIKFKLLTGLETEDVLKTSESRKKKGFLTDNLITGSLIKSIVSINGNEDKNKIQKFVSMMPARDSAALRKFIDENEPGIDMKVPFTCNNCDYSDTINVPFGPTFFWPNVDA